MPGTRRGTIQLHQTLRLPRKMNLIIDPHHIWNVISNSWSKQSHPPTPTSPNTAPATKSLSSISQVKVPEDDNPSMKLSSHARRFGDLPGPIFETILYCKIQHFALRLSPKMSRSVAPATKSHPPTSPNTAPATQNQCHQWSASHMSHGQNKRRPI